jgi:hypothetical protein
VPSAKSPSATAFKKPAVCSAASGGTPLETYRSMTFLARGRDERDRLAEGLADDSGHLAEAERLVRVEIVALVAMARVGQQLGVRLGEIGDGGIDLGIRRCVRVSQRDVSDCSASSFPIRWRSNGALRSSV